EAAGHEAGRGSARSDPSGGALDRRKVGVQAEEMAESRAVDGATHGVVDPRPSQTFQPRLPGADEHSAIVGGEQRRDHVEPDLEPKGRRRHSLAAAARRWLSTSTYCSSMRAAIFRQS